MDILRRVGEKPQLPPTIVFNEGWLLRLVLDSLDRGSSVDHPLSFAAGAEWFSEARLPTPFKPRQRVDKMSESYTHADGVIGHIKTDRSGRGYLELAHDATQFVVIEAKMFSRLSGGVKNAPTFHQAARNVACMAELLRRNNRPVSAFQRLGFLVLAPQESIDAGMFRLQMAREHIRVAVEERVSYYGDEAAGWHIDWFVPLIEMIELECVSWENALNWITAARGEDESEIRAFYENCLKYNRPKGLLK